MMCFGLYYDIGIKESWQFCDSKVSCWSRVEFELSADFKVDVNADVFRIVH